MMDALVDVMRESSFFILATLALYIAHRRDQKKEG